MIIMVSKTERRETFPTYLQPCCWYDHYSHLVMSFLAILVTICKSFYSCIYITAAIATNVQSSGFNSLIIQNIVALVSRFLIVN